MRRQAGATKSSALRRQKSDEHFARTSQRVLVRTALRAALLARVALAAAHRAPQAALRVLRLNERSRLRLDVRVGRGLAALRAALLARVALAAAHRAPQAALRVLRLNERSRLRLDVRQRVLVR